MLLVATSGAIGALGRWGLSSLVNYWCGTRFAYGTLVVNVLGCFLLGMVMEAWTLFTFHDRVRLILATGFLGAFTTYSTFGIETFRFIETGAWHKAVANVSANLVVGILAVWLGVELVRLIAGNQ